MQRRRSLREIGRRTGIDPRLLSKEIHEGRLPAERIGRALAVDDDDFRPWLRGWLDRMREQLEAPPQ